MVPICLVHQAAASNCTYNNTQLHKTSTHDSYHNSHTNLSPYIGQQEAKTRYKENPNKQQLLKESNHL